MNNLSVSGVIVLVGLLCYDVNGLEEARFYPCSWVGKTFKVTKDNTTVGSWSFDITGKDSLLEILDQVHQLECVGTDQQFILLRKIDTELTSCISVYNISENAFMFYYPGLFVDRPTSLCDVCKGFEPFLAVFKYDAFPKKVVPNAPLSCLYPEGCGNLGGKSLNGCNDKNWRIDEGTCDRSPPPMPNMKM